MCQWHVECGQNRCEEMLRDEGMFPEERGHGSAERRRQFRRWRGREEAVRGDVSGDEIIGAEVNAGEEQVAVL